MIFVAIMTWFAFYSFRASHFMLT